MPRDRELSEKISEFFPGWKNQLAPSMNSGMYSLRSSHMDDLSITSSIQPRVTRNYSSTEIVSSSLSQFSNSYFYRTMNNWNSLPYDARSQKYPKQFESAAIKWLWQVARPETE